MNPIALSAGSVPTPRRSFGAARHGSISSGSPAVYVRRRVLVGIAAVVMAIVAVSFASTQFADAGQGIPPVSDGGSTSVVIVQPGDTLWSLARDVQPDGDVRPLVAQLARSHGGSSLRAGDRIALPGH